MSDSAEMFEQLKSITIEPAFESVCLSLTTEEFKQLEQNILSDGEVTSPLVVWDGILIDGHNRRQIILTHPELPFSFKEMAFTDKYEAIAWICKNQLGRRNLSPEDLAYLIGRRYAAEKHSWGAFERTARKRSSSPSYQNDNLGDSPKTIDRIAKEYGIGSASVSRAEQYAKGIDAAEAACPGIKKELLSGSLKPTRQEVSALSKLPPDEIVDKISGFRKAQAEREEGKRQARGNKPAQKERKEAEKTYTSIGELSANMEKPKQSNNVSNVIGIITELAQKLILTCEAYIGEFPELMGTKKPLLFQATEDLREYLNTLHEEE